MNHINKNSYIALTRLLLSSLLLCLFASCSSSEDEYDPYYDWAERNSAWYRQIADSARTAINEARKTYGDAWESHCEWRMYKSLHKSPSLQSGILEDSICVHIISSGTGISPLYNDSVRVSFRGWLMPVVDEWGDSYETIFSQTYYGPYNPATAAPQLAAVSSFKDGVATALQYMHVDDKWVIYLPQELFYGATASGLIPAYSTACMQLHLRAVYPLGTEVPDWK